MQTRSGRTPPRSASQRRQTTGGVPSSAASGPPPRSSSKSILQGTATAAAEGGGGRRQSLLPVPSGAVQQASNRIPPPARRLSAGGLPYNVPPKSVQQKRTGAATTTTTANSSTPVRGGEPPRRRSLLPAGPGHANDRNAALLLPPSGAQADANAAARRRSRTRQSLLPPIAEQGGAGGGRENEQPPGTPSNRLLASTAASRRRSAGGADFTDAMQRRKSAGPQAAATPGKARRGVQDTRPITDPGFKRDAAQFVLKYLKDREYPLGANQNTLLAPSGSEFKSIVTFLMQQLDPSFQNHSGENSGAVSARFEDEVATYFKFLGYPPTLSKTGMASAGSAHSWPPLLAALSWLVSVLRAVEEEPDIDYLRSDQEVSNQSPQKDRSKEKTVLAPQEEIWIFTVKGFNQFTHESYLYDHLKRPEQKDRVLEDFACAVERGDELAERELKYLVETVKATSEEVTKQRTGISEIEEKLKERDTIADWIKDYEISTAPGQEKLLARLAGDTEDKKGKVEMLNAEIRELQAQIQKVQLQVKQQVLNTQDDIKLSIRIKGLSEAIEREDRQKEKVQAELVADQQELKRLKRECAEKLHESLQSKLSELEDTLPAELRAPNKISQWKKQSVDDLVSDRGGVILGEIKSLSVQGKALLKKHLESLGTKHQDVLDRLEESRQALKDSVAKTQSWRDKSDKVRAVLEQEHAAHRSKLAVRQNETSHLEERVAQLQDPSAFEARIAAIERQCEEQRSEIAEKKAKNAEWIRSTGRDIERAVECLQDLDAFFESGVRDLEDYNQALLARAETIRPPAGWKPCDPRPRPVAGTSESAIAAGAALVGADGATGEGDDDGESSIGTSANKSSGSASARSKNKKNAGGGGSKNVRRSSRRKSRL